MNRYERELDQRLQIIAAKKYCLEDLKQHYIDIVKHGTLPDNKLRSLINDLEQQVNNLHRELADYLLAISDNHDIRIL